jgi:hypothetical protein
VIWELTPLLHTGKQTCELDGLQPTSRTEQLDASTVYSIMSVLQNDVTAYCMQAKGI